MATVTALVEAIATQAVILVATQAAIPVVAAIRVVTLVVVIATVVLVEAMATATKIVNGILMILGQVQPRLTSSHNTFAKQTPIIRVTV